MKVDEDLVAGAHGLADGWLIADIGATNARFALGGRDGLATPVAKLYTPDYAEPGALIAAARGQLGFGELAGCCIAMAGPVANGRGEITNGSLGLEADDLGERLGCPSMVVNDFVALGHALPDLKQLRPIGGEPQADGVRALVGPGSGLGMSVVLGGHHGKALTVLPSEGGHGDLAPGSPLELEVLQILSGQLPHVCWESVLSGPGLVNLYRALSAVWGVVPEDVSPEWVTSRGVHADEPICHQVLEMFFGMLGAAAGNLALSVCAAGGVYIGGGIVPAIVAEQPDFAAASPMRRRFDERGALSEYASKIPLYLILDENPGLIGALACLRARVAG